MNTETRAVLAGYAQQIAAMITLLGMNLLLPVYVGLSSFGELTALIGMVSLPSGLSGALLDLPVIREFSRERLGRDGKIMCLVIGARIVLALIFFCLIVTVWPQASGIASESDVSMSYLVVAIAILGASGGLYAYLTALGQARLAAQMSLLHAIPYVGFPIIAWRYFGPTTSRLFAATILSYCLSVAISLTRLPKLDWNGKLDIRFLSNISKNIPGTLPIAIFEQSRGWATILFAASSLPAESLAIMRTSLSISNSMMSLVPVPTNAMFSVGGKLGAVLTIGFTQFVGKLTASVAVLTGLAVTVYGIYVVKGPTKLYLLCGAASTILTLYSGTAKLALVTKAIERRERWSVPIFASVLLLPPLLLVAGKIGRPEIFLFALCLSLLPLILLGETSKVSTSKLRIGDPLVWTYSFFMAVNTYLNGSLLSLFLVSVALILWLAPIKLFLQAAPYGKR